VAKLYVPAAVANFDEHRNTSRVWPVPRDAHKDALRALAHWRDRDPALYQWVAEGHPLLTEHLRRFGEPYKQRPKRAA
jgi:hypothetical protein